MVKEAMFKKVIIVLILTVVCFTSVFSLDLKDAEPYEKIEFPKWALDLRRGETIFFGSLPLTVPVTFLVFSIAENGVQEDKKWSFWAKMGVACGISAAISVTDYILGKVSGK